MIPADRDHKMTLRAGWIDLIYRIATGSRKLRTILTPVVGLSYAFLAALFGVGALILDRALQLPLFPPAPLHLFLAVLLIAPGLLLVLWCLMNFIKVKGTPVPFNPPPVLVASGPYAYTRNPMLSGLFLMLFGLGSAFQSISLMFLFTPLFILLNVAEIKMIEEPELEMRLGNDYRHYRNKTPMFFPRIR
ncbi:MAG: isoprenylcysteine carboxylmethyltransferase family protein [Deltaproteobacteria bacterium]